MARRAGNGTASETRPEAAGRPTSRRRRRLRRTIIVLVTVGVLGAGSAAVIVWKNRPNLYRPGEEMEEITQRLDRDLPDGAPRLRFTNVTEESGLAGFGAFLGPRSSQLPEDMGPGAAWGDFDNDGDEDLFLVSAGGSLAADPETWGASVLLENVGDGAFRKVESFPALRIIGLGAAWGDCDGDGWLDLVVTGFDALRLFRNEQGSLVRDESFPDPRGFWAGALWGDFDNDRDLDLYVSGYVRYVRDDAKRAVASRQFGTMVPYTLNPSSYEAEGNLLYRNDGDGSFEEVAEALGVRNASGKSLGALWHDFDQDGWLDLYVANDVSDNAFYRNEGGRFTDISHAAWVADYRGAMGMTAGDHDRDGDDDIFVTHWVAQENGLYQSQLMNAPRTDGNEPAPLRFVDVASAHGLGQPAIHMIGWGTEFADFDADGWLDLVVANGSTFETEEEPRRLKRKKPFLFWNRRGYFHDLAPHCEALTVATVARGLAVCDYDQDGDLDVLFACHDDGGQLLRNDTRGGHWIQLRLRSLNAAGAPIGFADGAVIIATVGDATLRRTVGSTSYLSQSSRTLHLGLGDAETVSRLEIRWLAGGRDVHTNLEADALWELVEGEAAPRLVREGDPGGAAVETDPVARRQAERDRVMRFWASQRAGMQAMKVDGDIPAAIAHFRAALALDPDHLDSHYYLANCLATVGDMDAAFPEFETLLRLDPRSHRGLKRLGTLRAIHARAPEDLERALEILEQALSVNREETGVLLVMGEVELMLGRDEQAETRLAWVSRTNPRAVSAHFLRGYLAWQRGDDAEARRLLESARSARGEAWKPQGTTAEGDVASRMHEELTPLSPLWRAWDNRIDPDVAYAPLAAFLKRGATHPESS